VINFLGIQVFYKIKEATEHWRLYAVKTVHKGTGTREAKHRNQRHFHQESNILQQNKKLCYHRRTVWRAVLFFSRPRSEGWPHHWHTFSIFLCPLSFWLTLPWRVLSTSWCYPSRPCVAFLACVHLALFLALSLSPGNSLVSSRCDEFCRRCDRLAMPKFSKLGSLGQSLRENFSNFWRHPYFLITQRGIGGRKPPCQKSPRLVQSFRYNTGLWQTDG